MTEITRVPLQPIARGAIGKLWLGVVLAIALGGAVAYETRQKGLEVDTLKAGSGPSPIQTDFVLINYVGRLPSGKEFDRGDHAPLQLQGMIPGFTQAVEKMQKGGKYHVYIPARLAYGPKGLTNPQTGEAVIPANSDLAFDIDLIDYKSAADVMRQRMLMQQLQRQMQGSGAPGGGTGGAPGGGTGGAPGGSAGSAEGGAATQ